MKTMRFVFFITALLLAGFAPGFAKELQLTPNVAEYRAKISKGLDLSGTARRELRKQDDGTWLYQFYVDTLPATIEEKSVFALEGNKLKSLSYNYLLSGMLIKNREQKLYFDYKSGVIEESYKKKNWQTPIQENLLDRLNYQLHLQLDIATGQKESTYLVMHKGQVREYMFRVIGEETINTALGDKSAVVVEKVRDQSKKRETILWFGVESPYPLLKMIQTEEDGERYEIDITKLN